MEISIQLTDVTAKELLQLQALVIDELSSRKVVRTLNNPLGDYTEWLVARALNLELETNSKAGYDGIDNNGTRIQIKGRRITPKSKSRQLSAIRNYNDKDFDILVAVIFDKNYDILEAWSMSHNVIAEYASFSKHTNSHILTVQGALLNDERVRCIKTLLNESPNYAK